MKRLITLIIAVIVLACGLVIGIQKESTGQIRPVLEVDYSYIDTDLIDKFENRTTGWVLADNPSDCGKGVRVCHTLENYQLVEQLNRYKQDSNFVFKVITQDNDLIKQLLTNMRAKKISFDARKI